MKAAAVLLSLELILCSCIPIGCQCRVHLFYYLWYGSEAIDGQWKHWNHAPLPHWNEKVRDRFPHGEKFRFSPPDQVHSPFYPARGPYSSQDPLVIEEHMVEALAMNAAMVLSWWGQTGGDSQDVNTDSAVEKVVRIAEGVLERANARDDSARGTGLIAFHLEPYEGRNVSRVRSDLQYLLSKYRRSPALVRVSNVEQSDPLPVFYVYDSYHIGEEEWAKLLRSDSNETIRRTDLDGYFIALCLDEPGMISAKRAGFDACYSYFASGSVSPASKLKIWPKLAKTAKSNSFGFVPSVGPGYNDTKIRPWNTAATEERNRHVFAEKLEYALQIANEFGDSVVPFLSITSYNEWGEGTQIERAVEKDGYESYHSVDYVEIVRNLSSRFHGHLSDWKVVEQKLKNKVEL